ncbi:Uncharacterised protein [Yersinia pseudotuberculosis]|nr:Uncharacterised protein [Yersinia pseudotuberculosis]
MLKELSQPVRGGIPQLLQIYPLDIDHQRIK